MFVCKELTFPFNFYPEIFKNYNRDGDYGEEKNIEKLQS